MASWIKKMGSGSCNFPRGSSKFPTAKLVLKYQGPLCIFPTLTAALSCEWYELWPCTYFASSVPESYMPQVRRPCRCASTNISCRLELTTAPSLHRQWLHTCSVRIFTSYLYTFPGAAYISLESSVVRVPEMSALGQKSKLLACYHHKTW